MFTVLAPDLTVSDHSPIVMYLKVKSFVSFSKPSENVFPKPDKLNWDSKIKDRYMNLINSDECKHICSSFLKTGIKPEQNSVDAAVKLLSDIMTETAERADLSIKLVRKLVQLVPRRGGCRAPQKIVQNNLSGTMLTAVQPIKSWKRLHNFCSVTQITLG